jgi:hypothetical protein
VTGLEDSYTDWAADFQFDHTIPQWKNDVVSLRGTYIRENSSLIASTVGGAASFPGHHLNTVQGEAEYHFGNGVSSTVGLFSITGTADATLFPEGAVTGYTRFNGTNYDAAGRNASGNNSIYLMARFVF